MRFARVNVALEMILAYNIYLIAHHTGPAGDRIIKSYIERLKSATPAMRATRG